MMTWVNLLDHMMINWKDRIASDPTSTIKGMKNKTISIKSKKETIWLNEPWFGPNRQWKQMKDEVKYYMKNYWWKVNKKQKRPIQKQIRINPDSLSTSFLSLSFESNRIPYFVKTKVLTKSPKVCKINKNNTFVNSLSVQKLPLKKTLPAKISILVHIRAVDVMMNTVIPTEVELHQDTKNQLLK